MTRVLPELDLYDPDVRAHPEEAMARVRADSPMASSRNGHAVIGYELAKTVLRDPRLVGAALRVMEDIGIKDGPVYEYRARSLIMSLDDRHMRLRIPMARFLGPSTVKNLRDVIRGIVDDLFGKLEARQPVDFHAAVAELLPARVYCHLAGAPTEDAPLVGSLSEKVLSVLNRDPALTPSILDAYDVLFDYIDRLLAEKRRHPGDDMLSFFLAQEAEGKLSSSEVRDEAVAMLEASAVNTAHQTGLTVWSVLSRENVWAKLVADPSLIPAAVIEAIRLYSRPGVISRVAREDIEIDGVPIQRGEVVHVSIWAANRDPEKFEDPDEFRLDRSPNQPLSFSTGAYGCLGQSLARLEIEEILRHIVERYPSTRLLPGTVVDQTSAFHRWIVRSLMVQLVGATDAA
jgi:cytochrome P450